nr:XRE family transcriptional regulator [uncultured Mediterranean phage uvMED]|tara:strand:- start:829 stop:1518 length:690 start_codon:yes stop_codon:yes gene_type:complete
MNILTDSMVNMTNNLQNCIKKSGMTVTEVAAAKGVTQATLHRVKSGKVKLNIVDAEHYARILGVNVQQVLFEAKPIPVIGKCVIGEKTIKRTLHAKQRYEIYADAYTWSGRAAWLWETEKPYQGLWYDWHGAISFTRMDPIVDKYIDTDCYQHNAVVKSKTPFTCKLDGQKGSKIQITAGVLYPQPRGLYSVHNGKTNELYTDLDLEWATPTLSVVHRPDLCGIHINEI